MIPFFSSKPSLKVTVEQDLIFLHPNQNLLTPAEPTIDPEIRGTVLLTLPQKKNVKCVKVVFEGLCNAWGGGKNIYETSTTLHKELEIDLKGEVLEAGDHAFNFSFIVPSNTAVYQRCNFGRVRHYVKAFVEYGSSLSSSTITSGPVAIFISANPMLNQGDIPEPLEMLMEHYSDDIGPVRCTVSSPHLTPSSLVSTQLLFLAPPSTTQIISIKTSLYQQYAVHYPLTPHIATPPEERYVLLNIDKEGNLESLRFDSMEGANGAGKEKLLKDKVPVLELEEGSEEVYERIMRVPDDDHVRPTTLSGTETRIRVSHRLSVEIRYRVPGSTEDKLLTLGKNVVVASCCCLLDTLYLPAYQKSAPKTVTRPKHLDCLCHMPLKDVYDRDGLSLQRAMELPRGPPYEGGERELGRDRGEKSPSVEWVRGMEG